MGSMLEPVYRGFLATAKRVRLFLEEVNSPRIRALLVLADLIQVNDLEQMFRQLGPSIDCLRAKDRKLHSKLGVATGQATSTARSLYGSLRSTNLSHRLSSNTSAQRTTRRPWPMFTPRSARLE